MTSLRPASDDQPASPFPVEFCVSSLLSAEVDRSAQFKVEDLISEVKPTTLAADMGIGCKGVHGTFWTQLDTVDTGSTLLKGDLL